MWERYPLIALLSAEKEIKDEVAQYELNSLVWCQKRSQLSKIQYLIFDKVQFSHPNIAVHYLYDSMKKGCYRAVERFAHNSRANLNFPFETSVPNLEDLDVSELFPLALRSHVGLLRFRDNELTVRCFKRILSLEPFNLEVHNNLGVLFYSARGVESDIPEAVERFRFAAMRGLAQAQFELGDLYHCGVGVFRDENEAIKWYRCAAVQGCVNAQKKLGWILSREAQTEENIKEGVEWLIRAAEQGNKDARFYLECFYKRSNNSLVGQNESIKWDKRTAIEGNVATAWSLALRYKGGDLLPQSNEESAKWFRVALKYGHKEAKERLLELLSETTPFAIRYHHFLSDFPSKNDIVELIHENRACFLGLLRDDEVIEQEHLFCVIQYVCEVSSSEECGQLLTEYLPCFTFSQMVTLFESHVNLRECLFNEEDPVQDLGLDIGLVLLDVLNKYKFVIQDNLIDSPEREAFHKMIYFTLSLFLMIARETHNPLRRDFSCVYAKLLLINFCDVSSDAVVNDLEDIEKVIAELNISNFSGRGLCGSVIR